MPTIVLDAGHTGYTWNKGAVPGYYESAVMWEYSKVLGLALIAKGFKVIYTRPSIETTMDVTVRGKKAKEGDLLLSLHSNSTDNTTTRRAVAIYQTDDSQGTWDTVSKAVANKLAAVIADVIGVTWQTYSKKAGGDRDGDGKKDDNYYGVLHGARMVKKPAVILEHSFHSNPETCRWLMNDANQVKLAEATADALADYFGLVEEKLPTKEPEKELYKVKVSVVDLRIRKEPGTDSTSIGYIQTGTHGIVAEAAGKGAKKWGKLADGRGWIALDYTTKAGGEPVKPVFQSYTGTVKPTNGLNVRAGAGTSYQKLGALSYKSKVIILEEKSGWGRINYKGLIGWVALQYIKKV